MKISRKIVCLFSVLTLILLMSSQVQAAADAEAKRPEDKTLLHGNISSKKFHNSSCRYYDCKYCKEIFRSRAEAIKAGFVPCKVCGG